MRLPVSFRWSVVMPHATVFVPQEPPYDFRDLELKSLLVGLVEKQRGA